MEQFETIFIKIGAFSEFDPPVIDFGKGRVTFDTLAGKNGNNLIWIPEGQNYKVTTKNSSVGNFKSNNTRLYTNLPPKN